MRRGLVATVLAVASIVPIAITGSLSHSYAQVGIGGPQGDEFNNDVFAAPFRAQCGTNAYPQTCPDAPGTGTYNLNREAPGYLRIYTQPGSLLGSANNARNLILQPFNPSYDFTVYTRVLFPGFNYQNNVAPLGQTAGLLEYQDQDNFIYVGRILNGNGTSGVSQLQFLQEVNGVDTSYTLTENNFLNTAVYFELRKVGNIYTGYYSYDNQNYHGFTVPPATVNPVPTATLTPTALPTSAPTAVATTTATATPVDATFTASGFTTTPQVGVFAYGGTSPQVGSNVIPADFDWFRTGNPATPAPTALPTATGTPNATATSTVTNTPVPTSTSVATATSTTVPTSTSTAIPTAAATATATSTPVPTNTPTPKKKNPVVGFKYVSIWYHQVRRGTFEHLEVQAKKSVKHGIWVHVYFPTGIHYDYYTETDDTGHWVKEFNIPSDSVSKYSNEAVVTFQLWKGKTTGKNFATFFVVR